LPKVSEEHRDDFAAKYRPNARPISVELQILERAEEKVWRSVGIWLWQMFPASTNRRCDRYRSAKNRFTIGFARIAQDHAKDPASSCSVNPIANLGSQTEVHLYFLTAASFHAPNPLRLRCFKLANKTLYRLIRIAEVVLFHQTLVNTSGTQAHLDLSGNHLSQRFALAPAPGPNANSRNGWICRAEIPTGPFHD